MFKIFYMVPLDSFVTFSPNLSKFSGRGGGSVRWLCDILTNFSEFLYYWEGKESTSTWPFWKTFMNFPPPCLRGVAKHVSWVWWKIWQIRTDLGGGNVTYMRVGTKLLSKNITKQLFLFFASWRRLRYPSLLTLWISYVCYWKTSTLLFSQVKLQNPIIYKRTSLAAFLGVSFDRLINTFDVALSTENATHT